MFGLSLTRMAPLIEEMPEKLEIYSADSSEESSESVEIPVNRMMEYYFKSRYQVPVEEGFEKLADGLKRSAYSVRDVINLAEVSLESSMLKDKAAQEEELLNDASKKIQQEITFLKQSVKDFATNAVERFESVFLPLPVVLIAEKPSRESKQNQPNRMCLMNVFGIVISCLTQML